MKASPDIQVVIGLCLMVYASATIYAAIWRPKLMENPVLRPRWWGFGPRASRVAAGLGSGVWLTLGALLLGNAFGVLSKAANNFSLVLMGAFIVLAVIAQLVSGRH